MNARAQSDKKYGGMTIPELRVYIESNPGQPGVGVVKDLVDEVEAAGTTEVLQRLRRIETKIHKLAVHEGAEPEQTTVTISTADVDHMRHVQVQGYDVTLAQIRRAMEAHGWEAEGKIYITRNDDLLATMMLTRRN
jgi:hypothetical protein